MLFLRPAAVVGRALGKGASRGEAFAAAGNVSRVVGGASKVVHFVEHAIHYPTTSQ